MEQKLNIEEILKDKPQGTKLYDLLRNIEVELDSISHTDYENIIWCRYNDVNPYDLYGYSTFGTERGWLNGLQILLPSKEMRDWNKFAWKKGDILVTKNGAAHIIFEKFTDDTYTIFTGNYYCKNSEKGYTFLRECDNAITEEFTLETEDAAKTYISLIEERLDGKLNHETLEVEKAQLEFKDGDILSCDEDTYTKHTTLILHKNGCVVESLVSLIRHNDLVESREPINEVLLSRLYPAREDEKKELFDALAKKDKRWDSEKKQIVDLKQKWTPKPFDRVIVRCSKADKWSIDFFSYKVSNGYICTGDSWFGYCLPYNEETAKLVGTTNNVEDQV